MVFRGSIQNGVVVLDDAVELPQGTPVRVEVLSTDVAPAPRRCGGQWKGQVRIADDFDELPDDLADLFGVRGP